MQGVVMIMLGMGPLPEFFRAAQQKHSRNVEPEKVDNLEKLVKSL
jgi:hypothetical protein